MAKSKRDDKEVKKAKKNKKEKKLKKHDKKKKKSKKDKKHKHDSSKNRGLDLKPAAGSSEAAQDEKSVNVKEGVLAVGNLEKAQKIDKGNGAASSSDESVCISPKRSRKIAGVASRPKIQADDSSDDEIAVAVANENEKTPTIASKTRVRSRKKNDEVNSSISNNESNQSEEWKDSDEDSHESIDVPSKRAGNRQMRNGNVETPIKTRQKLKSPRIKKFSAVQKSTLSDSSDDEDDDSSERASGENSSNAHANSKSSISLPPESPTRKSPRKAISSTTTKIRAMTKESSESEFSDQDDDPLIHTFKASKKKRDEDESSYRADDDDDDDDSDENEERDLFNDEMSFENDADSESDNEDENSKSKEKPSAVRNINNDEIFDREEDSDDDNAVPIIRVTPLKFKRKRGQFAHEDLSDAEEEIVATPVGEKRQAFIRPTPPLCASVNDEITSELLPSLHVCYLAPDRKTRHCFCLDTIYRASIMSGQKQLKADGSGGLAFLQPPHFRTVMEDGLVDQIASRFGRQAIIIENTEVYKKEYTITDPARSSFQDEFVDIVDEPQETFRDRFDRYLKDQMGSGDIYCCPVCYCEAQRRFRGEDSDDDEENDADADSDECPYSLDDVTFYSKGDPMTILGSLDHDDFQVAAAFCFTKLSFVKKHIRNIHNLDISEVEINDFLKKFAIRAQDALLQNYLRAYYGNRVFNGAMRKYWHGGHNQTYILLRVLIEHRKYMIEINDENVNDEFAESFPCRGRQIWEGLSAPYSKLDAADFIDSGEDEDPGDYRPAFAFKQPEFSEETFAAELRGRREKLRGTRKRHGYDSSSDESEDEESDEDKDDDEDEDEIIEVGDLKDEYVEESSEDEWLSEKRRRKRNSKTQDKRLRSNKGTSPLSSDDDDNELFVSTSVQSTTPSNNKDDLESSSDESEANSPVSKNNQTPSKVKILESDDDE